MTAPAIKQGSTGTIVGTNLSCVEQASRLRWTYVEGEVQQNEWHGPAGEIFTLYNNYKALAGSTPQLDSLELDLRMPARLVATFAENGETMYELLANDLMKPIYQHSYFDALTPAQKIAVRIAVDEGTTITTPAEAVALFNFLATGVEEYLETQYVLRETKRVSLRSEVKASYTNVNRVDNPPEYATSTPMISSVPTGEWLKRSPIVRNLGQRRWEVITEWWWANKWSSILYGGTGSP